MTVFGDVEPEDAWHPDDALVDLVRNLGRRIALVDQLPPPRGTSLRALVAAIADRRERAARRHRLSDRDVLRLEQIAVDLDLVRRRLEVET